MAIIKDIHNMTLDSAGVLTGPLNKLWRARILLNRAISTLPKDQPDKGKRYNPNGVSGEYQVTSKNPILNQQLKERWRLELQYPRVSETGGKDPAEGNTTKSNQENFSVDSQVIRQNEVIIYNMTSPNPQFIILQNRPNEVDFRGETTWATIKSMGRNTPMYHYTGSEDIIQFNVSWFSNDPSNQDDVVNKCRLLESWSKSNGYVTSPPILKIQWGNSNLFENQSYFLSSATYTLKNFRNAYRTRIPGKKSSIYNGRLLPMVATQELIFKRVSGRNLSTMDFINVESVKKTKGITL